VRKFIIAFFLFCSIPAIATQTGDEFTRPLGHDLTSGFEHDFAEIRGVYGETAVKETGDAGSYVGRVCYFTSDNSAVFEFYRTEVTDGFAFRLPNPQDRLDCSPSEKRISSNDLNVNGVKLGMKRETYERLIGHNSKSPGITVKKTSTYITHCFERKEPFTAADNEEEYWYISVCLHAEFNKVGLISFKVSYLATD